MADVFISYSKPHAAITRKLADELEAKGLSVWWDTDLLAGETFRDRIVEELKACKAAIVIWTPQSVKSAYVISEAERARLANKLIQLRTSDVNPSDLPPPFDTAHVSSVDDLNAIFGALFKLGVLRNYTPAEAGPLPLFHRDSQPFFSKRSIVARVLAPAAVVIIVAVLLAITKPEWAGLVFPRHEGTNAQASGDQGNNAIIIANRFFEDINAGLSDSSLFDEDVRLGRRGLMSKVDAVSELRKIWSTYSKINCRIEGTTPTLKPSQFAQNGFRVKVDSECDFTDQSGAPKTERFPLEIEATRDSGGRLLISGLWQPETMWFWQPRERDR
jgi:TIR domain